MLKKNSLCMLLIIVAIGLSACGNKNEEDIKKLKIHVFCNEETSYCKNLFNYLYNIDLPISVEKHFIEDSSENDLMYRTARYLGYDTNNNFGVPFVVINTKVIVGFSEDDKQMYYDTIVKESSKDYDYVVEFLQRNADYYNNLNDNIEEEIPLGYEITSINGNNSNIKSSSTYNYYCKVENFEATLEEANLSMIQVNYNYTLTNVNGESNHCSFYITIYDDEGYQVAEFPVAQTLNMGATSKYKGFGFIHNSTSTKFSIELRPMQ